MGGELFERLHEHRARYERIVRVRFPRAFGVHDAEDLVSTALDRAMCTQALPDREAEDAWFEALLSNIALDELRRRNGRPSSGLPRRTVLLSTLQESGWEPPADDEVDEAAATIERLDEDIDRAEARRVVDDALARLKPCEAEHLRLRHAVMPDATREECARAAGLSIHRWRYAYSQAWNHFVAVVSGTEPTPRCRRVRELIGELESGGASAGDAAAFRGRIDAHIMECSACHAFARDSYRILTPSTMGPIAGSAVAGGLAEGGGAGALVGAGASGAGLLAWLSTAGGVKLLTVVCAVSVTTASICGGVIAVMHGRGEPPARTQRAQRPAVTATPTAAPTAVATRTPDPIRTATPTPARRPRPRATASPARATDRAATQSQPAAAPSGSTGNEFDPVPASATSQPAPVSSGVTQEFAP